MDFDRTERGISRRGTSWRRSGTGYSVVEAVIAASVGLVVAGFSVVGIKSTVRNLRVERALETTMTEMRRARQLAMEQRQAHRLSFLTPRTLRIERRLADNSFIAVSEVELPGEFEFRVEAGIPTNPLHTPDQFGVGNLAVDFNGEKEIFFEPNGVARDPQGRVSNGVVYLARPGELTTVGAATLFGASGRVKGWRLAKREGVWVWTWNQRLVEGEGH